MRGGVAMIEWTNRRVVLVVVLCSLVSGLVGAEWQHQNDSAALPAANTAGYQRGVREGQAQAEDAKRQAFQDGYSDGRDVRASEISGAYEDGYEDGQADSVASYAAPEPVAPFYDSEGTNSASAYYANCTAAEAAGAAPVYRGDPGYATHLDRDGDGVGCE